MSSHEGLPPTARRRVLVVEDEILIGMLLEDMLGELGYAIAATASRVDEAAALARDGEFDAAILDVNLNGQDVYPVADILAARGIPFVFATGYGERGLPPPISTGRRCKSRSAGNARTAFGGTIPRQALARCND